MSCLYKSHIRIDTYLNQTQAIKGVFIWRKRSPQSEGLKQDHVVKEFYCKINIGLYENELSHFHKFEILLWQDLLIPYKHFVPLCRGIFVYKTHA